MDLENSKKYAERHEAALKARLAELHEKFPTSADPKIERQKARLASQCKRWRKTVSRLDRGLDG